MSWGIITMWVCTVVSEVKKRAVWSGFLLIFSPAPLATAVSAVSTERAVLEIAERDPARAKKKRAGRAGFRRDKGVSLPSVRLKSARKRRRIPLKDIRPPSVSRLYYAPGSDEAELESVLNQEIDYLFKLIQKDRRGDMILRLGSLYVEKARFITFKIQSDYDQRISEFEEGRRKTKPRMNLAPAVIYNGKAIKLFAEFKKRYPKSSRMDEVLFFLGFNSYQLDRPEDGAKFFQELETRFPKSAYIHEAHFQLGEHYFKKKNWNQALRYYGKTAKKKRSKFYFLALYKMAWSHYKKGKAVKGLTLLERIIREGRRETDSQRFAFTAEAVEDLTLFYTYSGKSPVSAPAYFYRFLGEKSAKEQLEKLAYSYRDTGHTKGVVALFTHLIEEDPLAPQACEYRRQMVETLYHFSGLKQIMRSASGWVQSCGKKSAWAVKHARDRDRIRSSRKYMEAVLKNYALRNHQLFRKTKTDRARLLALGFYEIYFSEFKSTPHSDQMSFFHGELLFDSKKYVEAVKKYEEVISKAPSGKYAVPAYTNQILALEKLLPDDREVDRLTAKAKGPVALPPKISTFIKTALRYVKRLPKQKNSSSVLYRVGSLYYHFNHLDKSAVHLGNLYSRYPSVPYISDVGGLLLDIYNRQKDYESLKKLAVRFVSNKKIDRSLVREAQSILQQLSFKQAQDLAVQKKFRQSAVLYEKFAKENPSSPLASSSYYNSAINYEKSSDLLKAVAMYSAVLTYKKSPLKIRKKCREYLPVLYEKLGLYRKAAEGYSDYAGRFPKDSKSVSYRYNAGVIYDAFNNIKKAALFYEQYFQLSRSPEKAEILYLTGRLYERNGRWTQAVQYYDRYRKSSSSNRLRQVQAVFQVAEIYKHRLKNPNQAKVWYDRTLHYYRKFRIGASFSARAEMRRGLRIYDQFKAVRIGGGKNQASLVNKKIQLLKNLENALKPVVRYNDGEQIIASLVLTGLAYQRMAEDIFRAPLPGGLNKEGRKKYREGIKKVISPYLKRAVESHELALRKSKKFKVHSEWVRMAFDGLYRIDGRAGAFKGFRPAPVEKEILSTALLDDTKMMSDTFLDGLSAAVRYRVSREEKGRIFRALKSGRESAVLAAVSRVLNKDTNNIFAINALSLFYLKHKKPQMGVLLINRVLAKKPKIAPLLNNLGVILLNQGRIREAIVYFKKSLKSDPSDVIANANLGAIFAKNHDFENAAFYLEKAYNKGRGIWKKKDPRWIAVVNNYGASLAGAGRWKTARLLYDRMAEEGQLRREILLNQAIVLSEGFKDQKSRLIAKGLVNELSMGHKSVRFRRKLDRISSRLRRP